ncbi:MAG TPA: glycosyltransferase family 39 protein, partial [Candidatus Binataceae bacterium]|nr:glycosyltransferase family 39 protein [Candidatus Binataceae bacterium]
TRPAPPSGARPRTATALSAVAVLGLAGALFFFHLGRYGLWEPDEARYAEIAREMLATGNYIVPHLNYVPYIEKPPLLYWTCAITMRLLGVNEFAARFINALSALIGVAATFYFTLRTFAWRKGLIAGVVLATSCLYAVMAQVLTTDMLLTASITVALFAAFLHWCEGGRWRWLFYIAMGLGILTKGPIAAALPLLILLIFCWWEGGLRGAIARFRPVSGLLLTGAIAAPWFIAITVRQPDFIRFYFLGEYFRRFFDRGYSHSEPIYYYVPIILAGMLPWTLMIPLLPWRRLSSNPARRFCLIASATTFVIFSLASAKLVPYILPALPPIAVIVADGLGGALESAATHEWSGQWASLAGLLLGLAGIALIIVAVLAPHLRSPNPMLVRPALYAAGTILMAGGIISAIGFWIRRPVTGLSVFGLTAAALLVVISYGRILAEPARSYAALARTLEQRAPGATLVCYPRYIQSLPFYTRRRVILVGDKTELTYGAAHSPDASQYFFNGPKGVIHLWDTTRDIVLVIDKSALASIQQKLGPFEVIAEDSKKLALAHPRSALTRPAIASPPSAIAGSNG